ncbi:MAG: lytic transglycosylase domain-containing protein [Candidatus Aenigmatarchaeota archaeon]
MIIFDQENEGNENKDKKKDNTEDFNEPKNLFKLIGNNDPKLIITKIIMFLILIIIQILIFLFVFFNLKKIKILFIKIFINELITDILIFSFSMFLVSLLFFVLSNFLFKKLSNFYKLILLISIILIIGSLLIWLFLNGPFNKSTQKISSFFKKIGQEISIQLCYLSPERVASGNYDDCKTKDKKKIGEYKNIEIKFSDPKYGYNPKPIAGKGYNLKLFLKNLNSGESDIDLIDKKNIYDIKVKKIVGIASNEDLKNYNEKASIVEAINDKEFILYPSGEIQVKTLTFDKLPSECQIRMYFKVVLTTEQFGKGVSKFLVLPDYSYENYDEKVEKEIKNFNPEILASPGPVDIFVYTQPFVITSEETEDISFFININSQYGFSLLKNIKLLIQRDYIKIEKCYDAFGERLEYLNCKDSDYKNCINFIFDKDSDGLEIKRYDSYSIECKARIDKSMYNEKEKISFVTAEISYLHNFEEYTSLETRNCLSKTKTTAIQEINRCKGACFEDSCPEGFKEIEGICTNKYYVCCESTGFDQECSYPNLCRKYNCPEGYKQVNKKCNVLDFVCCEPDCPELEDNCATGEIVLKKIACEARKKGVKPSLALAIAHVENNFKHCNYDGTVSKSSSGAIGLMQIMPGGCKDPYNINENIRCGIDILKEKCESSANTAVKNGFSCYRTGPCTNPDVTCIYDCSDYGFKEEYSGWDLAIRGYNGWGCCVRKEDKSIDCASDLARNTRNYVKLVKNVQTLYYVYDT